MRRFAWLALAFGLTFSRAPVLGVSFPLTWRWSNPTPHGNNIIDVATTNSFWIQVAERGQIYTSGDLVTWTPRDSHTTKALRAVTFFKDFIVISAESGTILAGPSASELSVLDVGGTDWLEGVAASLDLAVAVGDNGAILTSSDAFHWQRQQVGFSDWLRSVAFGTPGGARLFVTVGEGGFVATSADGVNWQSQSKTTLEDLNRVTWFNGEFWAVGNAGIVLQSTSGKSWVPIQTGATNALNAFAGAEGMRLVAGAEEVRLRTNRTAWADQLAPANSVAPPNWTYLSGTGESNRFLLCGRTGMMVQGILTNGSAIWFPISESPRNWLWDLKRFPSTYLAVGDRATILSSVDGTAWDQELPPDAATNSVFLGIGGRTNLAVAVGSAGTIITSLDTQQSVVSTNSNGTLTTNQVSTLGIFWDSVNPRPTTNDLQGITTFKDRFVVTGGGGTILTSSDAKTWARQNTATTAFLSGAESFPGGIVTVGQTGVILVSADGVNWNQRDSAMTNWLYKVRFVGDKLITVGQNGSILTSADGNNWSRQSSGTAAWLNDVQWISSTYFVVGNQGTVLSSPDAVTWTDRGTITGKSLFGAAQDRGMLVVVGVEGTVLRSQVIPLDTPIDFLRYPRRPDDNVFLFSGQSGQRFALDRSFDLQSWIPGPTLEIDPSGTLVHLDSGTNAPSQQFFRAKLKP